MNRAVEKSLFSREGAFLPVEWRKLFTRFECYDSKAVLADKIAFVLGLML